LKREFNNKIITARRGWGGLQIACDFSEIVF